MRVNLLRKIDSRLGPVICKIILLLRKTILKFSSRNQLEKSKDLRKVLIIKFFGMGTILLSSPAILELKKKFPNLEVSFLTLAQNKEVCETLASVDTVFLLRIDSLYNFVEDFVDVLVKLNRVKFDVIFDLEFLTNFSALTTLLLTVFKKNVVSVGFNSPLKWRNLVYTLTVAFDHSRHISKIFGKMMSSVCGEISSLSFDSEKKTLLDNCETEFLNNMLPQCDSKEVSTRRICININSGPLSYLRRWPEEYFLVLVDKLTNKYDVIIVLIGGVDDCDYVNNFYSKLQSQNKVINLCGMLSFRQLSGLFTKVDLFISNDSGPLHLAAILGLPTISFFGPETPSLYAPIGNNHHVFYKDIFCSPCLNIYNSKFSSCQNNVCLKGITPDTVLKVINDNNFFDANQGI